MSVARTHFVILSFFTFFSFFSFFGFFGEGISPKDLRFSALPRGT